MCCVLNVRSFLCLLSVFLRTVQTEEKKKDYTDDNLIFSVARRNTEMKHTSKIPGP